MRVIVAAMVLCILAVGAVGQSRVPNVDLVGEIKRTQSVAELAPFLSVNDLDTLRAAIRKLASFSNESSQSKLHELWSAGSDSKAAIGQPEVRVVVAHYLSAIRPAPDYTDYIVSRAGSGDWVVRAAAMEALLEVEDGVAVPILERAVRNDDYFVARAALQSLRLKATMRGSVASTSAIRQLNGVGVSDSQLSDAVSAAVRELDEWPPRSSPSETTLLDKALETGDMAEAIRLVLPGAQAGDLPAQHMLGELYLQVGKPGLSRDWLTKASQAGHHPATTSLAQLYIQGRGVEVDRKRGVSLLRQAAEAGDPSATELLRVAKQNGWWGVSATE